MIKKYGRKNKDFNLMCVFHRMAWTTQEEAYNIFRNHLGLMSLEDKKAMVKRVHNSIFPDKGSSGAQTIWKTKGKVTRITTWGHENLLNNLCLTMVKESLG